MCANAEEMSLQLYFTNVGKNMGKKNIYIFFGHYGHEKSTKKCKS